MAKELGWIKVYRKIQDTTGYFAEPFCRNMAWIDLLLLANHEDNFFRYRGIRIDVKRGQTGVGIDKFCDRWKWSRGKVERFLKELELDFKIVRQKTNITTLITILNYKYYQDGDKADSKATDKADGQQMIKQTDTNKNDNNDKIFNNKPVASDFNGLPELTNGMVIELVKITKDVNLSVKDVNGLWDVFKGQNLNGKKYYRDEDSVYSHFINWAKDKKFDVKGKKDIKPDKLPNAIERAKHYE